MAGSSLKDKIRDDMNDARRRQDKDRARLLSTLLSDIKNREIELKREAKDDDVVEVLAKAVKMRNEAAEQMASRPELAEHEKAEAEALKEYMPAQLDEGEIRHLIVEAVEGGAANIGAIMGSVMPQLKGRAEGKEVNRIAREVLASRASGD